MATRIWLEWDARMLRALRRFETPARTRLAKLLTAAGNASGWLAVTGALGAVGKEDLARHVLVSVTLATLVVQPLKRLCRRRRPSLAIGDFTALAELPDAFSFPSGHAAAAFAVAGVLADSPAPIAALSLGWALAIGLSRVYLGVHYPLDVAAGALLGLGSGLAARVASAHLATLTLPGWLGPSSLAVLLAALAITGLVLLVVQLVALAMHVRGAVPVASTPVSVLKPLCGVDDGLEENLARFAELDHRDYEVLLGVEGWDDPAVAYARAAVERWPHRFRLVVQEGAPGLNPKINQLLTLTRHARYELLVVSDSNVRVGQGYLGELAALLVDPDVGLVTNPVAGGGARTLGAACDALHLCSGVGMGQVAAKRVSGRDLVVGKSMALRRADLEAMGGWRALQDVLAEDYLAGRLVAERLGKRVAVARTPVQNHSVRRSLGSFVRRYQRWSIMQRFAVGPWVYASMLLLNPTVLAGAALLAAPGRGTCALLAASALGRIAVDLAACRLLGTRLSGWFALAAPLKELLVGWAWCRGLVCDEVDWRGKKLKVRPGTRLERPEEPPAPATSAAAC